jgi:hypothetical protein
MSHEIQHTYDAPGLSAAEHEECHTASQSSTIRVGTSISGSNQVSVHTEIAAPLQDVTSGAGMIGTFPRDNAIKSVRQGIIPCNSVSPGWNWPGQDVSSCPSAPFEEDWPQFTDTCTSEPRLNPTADEMSWLHLVTALGEEDQRGLVFEQSDTLQDYNDAAPPKQGQEDVVWHSIETDVRADISNGTDTSHPQTRDRADNAEIWSKDRLLACPNSGQAVGHTPKIQSQEEKLEHIKECAIEAGFADLTDVFSRYYTADFDHESRIATDQRRDRQDRLPALLATLHASASSWTQWESHSCQYEIIKSAQNILDKERYDHSKFEDAADMEVMVNDIASNHQGQATLVRACGTLTKALQNSVRCHIYILFSSRY